MKLKISLMIILQICLQTLTMQANDLQALENQRELRRLAKIKVHGEPLEFKKARSLFARSVAFSPDGKYFAASWAPRKGYDPDPVVVIYDLAAEKNKRIDQEIEKMK